MQQFSPSTAQLWDNKGHMATETDNPFIDFPLSSSGLVGS